MKTQSLLLYIPLAALSVASMFAGAASKPFLNEGVWRGEFTLAEQKIPFNFELKGTTPEHATFTLINGSRRDDFHVKQQDDGTLFVKMNTYDAAVVAKIDDAGHIN